MFLGISLQSWGSVHKFDKLGLMQCLSATFSVPYLQNYRDHKSNIFQNFSDPAYKYQPKRRPSSKTNGYMNGTVHTADEEETLIKDEEREPKKKGSPSFFLAVARALGPFFLICGVYKFFYDTMTFISPQILRYVCIVKVIIENGKILS